MADTPAPEDERDRLLAEIGIAPPEAPPSDPLPVHEAPSAPEISETIPAAVPLPGPRPAPSALARGRSRLCGGVMALAGAAWLGVGAATRSPLPVLLAGVFLVPGLLCWLSRDR
jgi:hypothetical protein